MGALWTRTTPKSEKVSITTVEGKGGLVSDVWYTGFVAPHAYVDHDNIFGLPIFHQ